jgi:predicted amidohydrolase YtcJ
MTRADLILVNPAAPIGLIAIAGNRILHVGAASDLDDLAGPGCRVLDCQGGLVVPGFTDAHCHPVAHAATLMHADCRAADIEGVLAILRAHAAERAAGQWVRGGGCEPELLREGRLPIRAELDAAIPRHPVVVVAASGQSCVLNSQAVALCGLGGEVGADGWLAGNDPRFAGRIPPLSAQELEAGMAKASRLYLSCGITALHDTSWSNAARHWQALWAFKDRGLLGPRVTMLAGYDALDEFAALGLKTGAGDAHLRLGAMKIALDESSLVAHPPQSELDVAAVRAHLAGFRLSFHVPDGTMMRRALQSLAAVEQMTLSQSRHPRFEHCPVCPPDLPDRMAGRGVVAVMQPALLHRSGPDYLRDVRPDRLDWVSPMRSMRAAGVRVAFGSDAPLAPCAPLAALDTAVTRKVAGGAQLCPQEGLSVADALECYTQAAAQGAGEETELGAIAPGMLADLAILDGNPLAQPDRLGQMGVAATILDGQLVWQAGAP